MSSSAEFDQSFYLTNNADVVVAISQGFFGSALQHYTLFGGKELRAPNATFDPNYYAVNNPDVLNAVSSGAFPSVFAHFQEFGEAENRAPSSTYATFDAAGYLEANADVAAAVTAGTFKSALDHFIAFGQTEARSGSGVSADATVNPGTTFTLTTSAESLTGSANDDSFNGAITYSNTAPANTSTLTTADVLNGGGGTGDRLNVVVDGTLNNTNAAVGFVVPTITNLEKIYVRNVATENAANDDLTINANNISGVSEIFSDRSTSTLSVTNLGSGDVIGVNGDGVTNVGNVIFTYGTASNAATITFTGGTQAAAASDVSANDTGRTAVTINSTGAANEVDVVTLTTGGTVTGLAIAASSNMSFGAGNAGDQVAIANGGFAANASITITGTGAVDLETLAANVDTIDAGGSSGGVTVALDAETDTTVTGSSGNDTISTGAALTTGAVNAGAGTDRLIVGTTAHLNSATLAGKYTNFETLEVTNGVAIDLDLLTSITAVAMTDGAGTTALTDLSATQAGAFTLKGVNGAATIGIKNASTVGQIDTANITVSDGDSTASEAVSTAGDLTMTDIELINFTLTDDLILDTIANMNEFSTITLSGGGNAEIFTAATGVQINSTIDGTAATSAIELNASAATGNGMSLKGGSGGDTLTGSAQADSLQGNAGNDTIFGGASADTITAGEGNDNIIGGNGADTMTGGDGTDNFDVATNGTTTVDVISDLALGTDNIFVSAAPSGGVVTSVTAASGSSLAIAAANAGTTIGANKAGIFTYSDESYLLINDATAGTISAADTVVKITGYTGTLAAGDLITSGISTGITGTAAQAVSGTKAGDTFDANTVDVTVSLNTTFETNGLDTIQNFTVGGANDIIDFLFGNDGELANNAALRGTGADLDTDGGTINAGLNTNTGLLTSSNGAADLNESTAVTRLGLYQGTIAASDIVVGDALYYAMDNGTDTAIFLFQDTSGDRTVDTGEVKKIATVSGLAAAETLIGADFADFT